MNRCLVRNRCRCGVRRRREGQATDPAPTWSRCSEGTRAARFGSHRSKHQGIIHTSAGRAGGRHPQSCSDAQPCRAPGSPVVQNHSPLTAPRSSTDRNPSYLSGVVDPGKTRALPRLPRRPSAWYTHRRPASPGHRGASCRRSLLAGPHATIHGSAAPLAPCHRFTVADHCRVAPVRRSAASTVFTMSVYRRRCAPVPARQPGASRAQMAV